VNQERKCYEFGGDVKDGFCYIDNDALEIRTDNQSCEELGVLSDGMCKIPLENINSLRRHAHPKYYDNELDQLTWEILVEESRVEEKCIPEEEIIQEITDKKVGDFVVIRPDGVTIGEIHPSRNLAREFADVLHNFMIEFPTKERLAWILYGEDYYDLDESKKRKIRYRINKLFGEFK